MPRNDEGEMELVLGNKQLLSVMFILVILLGVFFTMGYIVGRNNPSAEVVRAMTNKDKVLAAKNGPTITIDPNEGQVRPAKPTPTSVEPTRGEVKPAPAPEQKTKETPKKEEPKNEEPKKEVKAEPERKKEEPKKEEAKKKEPPPAPVESAGVFQATPPPGQYLQVAAIDRPGAMGMAEAYRKQGFSTMITPSSSPTLFRVVIGPLKSSEAVAETKLKLKKIGVEGAILRKF